MVPLFHFEYSNDICMTPCKDPDAFIKTFPLMINEIRLLRLELPSTDLDVEIDTRWKQYLINKASD